MPSSRTTEEAWAFLVQACESPAPATARLAREVGPLEVAGRYADGTLPDDVASEFRGDRADWDAVDNNFVLANELGARLVTPEHDEWPAALQNGQNGPVAPPLALWVQGAGRLNDLVSQAVAIIGSRLATSYGEHHAADLGYQLAERGWALWNSCAYGIDGAAQRGALACEGSRVAAVVAHGLYHVHPFGHDRPLACIAEQGVLVSEHGLTRPPSRHRFQMRNRLLAMLTSGVVIIEASLRSGVRNAAYFAHELRRPVLALPGPVTSRQSDGCHQLIIDRIAQLFTTVDDVEQALGSAAAPR